MLDSWLFESAGRIRDRPDRSYGSTWLSPRLASGQHRPCIPTVSRAPEQILLLRVAVANCPDFLPAREQSAAEQFLSLSLSVSFPALDISPLPAV